MVTIGRFKTIAETMIAKQSEKFREELQSHTKKFNVLATVRLVTDLLQGSNEFGQVNLTGHFAAVELAGVDSQYRQGKSRIGRENFEHFHRLLASAVEST